MVMASGEGHVKKQLCAIFMLLGHKTHNIKKGIMATTECLLHAIYTTCMNMMHPIIIP